MLNRILFFFVIATGFLAFQRSWLALASLAVVVSFGYEEFTRTKIRRLHRNKTIGKLKSRLPSLPYSEAEFNKQFLAVMGSQSKRSTRFFRKENISSSLINYIDGVRKTSFVQSHQSKGPKIRLFGGSTIDCQEVPDDFTIASQLQKRVNGISSFLNGYEVINYGVSGATLNANYDHFGQIEISKGDICIFFFGANETTFPSDFFKTKPFISFIPKLRQAIDLLERVQFVTLYRLLRKFMTFDQNHPLLKNKVEDISRILSLINSRCQSRGTHLAVILQPLLHTRVPFTQYDFPNLYLFPKTNFEAPLFLFEKLENVLKVQEFFFDGRCIFNQSDLDVYLDWVHTNHQGNKIIADYFYSIIQQNFLKS